MEVQLKRINWYGLVPNGRHNGAHTHADGSSGRAQVLKVTPCIADGDTGYGNAVNVKRTVKGYAQVRPIAD